MSKSERRAAGRIGLSGDPCAGEKTVAHNKFESLTLVRKSLMHRKNMDDAIQIDVSGDCLDPSFVASHVPMHLHDRCIYSGK